METMLEAITVQLAGLLQGHEPSGHTAPVQTCVSKLLLHPSPTK
jgi:hypothetical protein